MLQLSRLDYGRLTSGTMKVVDQFCFQVFDLDTTKDYFIKTGTFSSKFDFPQRPGSPAPKKFWSWVSTCCTSRTRGR